MNTYAQPGRRTLCICVHSAHLPPAGAFTPDLRGNIYLKVGINWCCQELHPPCLHRPRLRPSPRPRTNSRARSSSPSASRCSRLLRRRPRFRRHRRGRWRPVLLGRGLPPPCRDQHLVERRRRREARIPGPRGPHGEPRQRRCAGPARRSASRRRARLLERVREHQRRRPVGKHGRGDGLVAPRTERTGRTKVRPEFRAARVQRMRDMRERAEGAADPLARRTGSAPRP